MGLPREKSLAVAGGTAALVYATFAAQLPAVVDVRASQSDDRLVGSTIKSAAWSSAAIVVATSLITKDMTVFIAGGASIVMLTWLYKHGNMYDAGKASASIMTSRELAAATATGR